MKLCLTAEDMGLVFPFHVAFDPDMRVMQFGKSIAKLSPLLQTGRAWSEIFRVTHPKKLDDQQALLAHHGKLLVVELIGGQITMKGQILLVEGSCVFLGAPIIRSVSEMTERGIGLNDFAHFDSVVDLLFMMQSQTKLISEMDAKNKHLGQLNDDLAGLKKVIELHAEDLEKQVSQRTQELEASIAELKEAKGQAEQMGRAKAEFLANMSHEIRTPLNAINGMTHLLKQQSASEEQARLVGKIERAGKTLLTLINDVLDFSKIDANKFKIVHEPFELETVLDQLSNYASYGVGEKDLTVAFDVDPMPARYLIGDSNRLEQVLLNLLGNGLKFTQRGSVVLAIRLLEENPDQGRVKLRFGVKDSGIGIDKERQAELFTPFHQADTSTSRVYGGTGLGLAISQQLVNLMGGRITLQSELGAGSEFSFTLEFDCQGTRAPATLDPRIRRVAVVAGDSVSREILGRMVGQLGAEAQLSESAEAFLQRVQAPGEAPPDMILLDWKLPGMDGLQAMAELRKQHRGAAGGTGILMVTAAARTALANHPTITAVDEMLDKPLTASSLSDASARALRRKQPEALPQQEAAGKIGRLGGWEILVVDDNELNLEVAKAILELEGAKVQCAEDGMDALSKLRAQPDRYNLVLMDIQMPVMDGYQATRAIRADAKLSHLPVLALTAGAFGHQRDEALAAGVNDLVAKPFEVEKLIEQIRHFGAARQG